MHKSKIHKSFLAIASFCLCLGLVGCGGDEETAPAQPEVVATKIQTTAPKPTPTKKPAAPAPAKAAQPAAAPAAGEKAAADESSIQKTMEGIKKDAAAGAVSRYQARLYKPEGKIDPFENPFKEATPQQPTVEDEEDPNKPDRDPVTPLEKIDLSQLTLVGVIKFSSGYKAIVQEQSGKGYVIQKGTYIGTNYGQVTEIQSDRILIQEKVKNYLGKYKDQANQLKLQKPLGDN